MPPSARCDMNPKSLQILSPCPRPWRGVILWGASSTLNLLTKYTMKFQQSCGEQMFGNNSNFMAVYLNDGIISIMPWTLSINEVQGKWMRQSCWCGHRMISPIRSSHQATGSEWKCTSSSSVFLPVVGFCFQYFLGFRSTKQFQKYAFFVKVMFSEMCTT